MTTPRGTMHTPALALALVVGFASCGCDGTSAAPTAAEQDQAKKTLDQALTGWQSGQSIDGMKKASPSIVVADPKWEKGVKLRKFEIKGDGKISGAERVFAVSLSLTDANGKETTESVEYKVGTNPILTVFRALF